MNLKALVVDDEPVARKGIASYVEQTPFLTLVGTAKSALEANELLNSTPVDLLFLDIQMPDITGIEFIESLKNPPAVIFTTAYRDYATEGFELDAIDYMVKPITQERFDKAILKAQSFSNKEVEGEKPSIGNDLFVNIDRRLVKINIPDIYLIEAKGDYINIKTDKQNHLVHATLKKIEEKLRMKYRANRTVFFLLSCNNC